MPFFLRLFKIPSSTLVIVSLVLLLAACDGGGASASQKPAASSALTLTVSGKLDTEAQLLTQMYVLLLKHAGFKIVVGTLPATPDALFQAIDKGQLDLYPEFTATALTQLGLNSTGNAQQDYLQVKQGYEARYHMTWLAASPLNDTYGLCTSSAKASGLKITKISELKKKAAQLTLATTHEEAKAGVKILKAAYGITFHKVTTYTAEDSAFAAVSSGSKDIVLCHTTSAAIPRNNFVLLQDDKSAFPVYNPAPVVSDVALRKSPQIASILNKLAPFLTTPSIQQLQAQVGGGQSITAVATRFLQSKALL